MTFEEWWETYPAYERYAAAKDAWNAALEEAAKVCDHQYQIYYEKWLQAVEAERTERADRFEAYQDAAGYIAESIQTLKAK